jgi:DNA-binding beta-propeller fold protein YncE
MRTLLITLIVLFALPCGPACAGGGTAFAVDPYWPKPLPNNWILGQIGGIATDSHDHIWVLQRPGTLTDDERGAALNPPASKCCFPAPPVLEFDNDGNLLRHWGGPAAGYDWPQSEHGISVDADDVVWIAGNGKNDHQVLKFTTNGKFLMQIGHADLTGDSNSTDRLGRPALPLKDASNGELYVADGYKNHRIIVFDGSTGGYKRHWGAYGKPPTDETPGAYDPDAGPAEQFRNPVHCVRFARDGLVYVCDRVNDRVQVFRKSGEFVTEFGVEPRTRGVGSVWDIALSPDPEQTYLYVADGTNNRIHVLRRKTGELLSWFGTPGRSAGQFHWLHTMAIDSRGNLYTGEVDTGKRVQKFRRLND